MSGIHIRKSLKRGADRIAKAAGKGAEEAVGKATRQVATGTEQVARNTTRAEEKHAKRLAALAGPREHQQGPRKPSGSKFGLPANADRSRTQTSKQVDPNTFDLAKRVNQRRKQTGDESGNNYAAIEYLDENGKKKVVIGHSDGPHSERVIGKPLLERQRQLDLERERAIAEGRDPGPERKIKVQRIYSERDYCNQPNPNCNAWTRHYFPDAERYHAFEYDHYTPGSKAQGNRDHEDHRRSIFGQPPIKRRK